MDGTVTVFTTVRVDMGVIAIKEVLLAFPSSRTRASPPYAVLCNAQETFWGGLNSFSIGPIDGMFWLEPVILA